jgi:hypothetical protein
VVLRNAAWLTNCGQNDEKPPHRVNLGYKHEVEPQDMERLWVKMYLQSYGIWYLGMHLPIGSSERNDPVLVEGSVVTDEEISTLNLNRFSSLCFLS